LNQEDRAQDDACCAAVGWLVNDNIDHAACVTADANYGGTGYMCWVINYLDRFMY
jgi:hypothetical protein